MIPSDVIEYIIIPYTVEVNMTSELLQLFQIGTTRAPILIKNKYRKKPSSDIWFYSDTLINRVFLTNQAQLILDKYFHGMYNAQIYYTMEDNVWRFSIDG